ncbi:MAG: recombination regulator RecX [Oscillospiraceae bacterium]|nr:recombination regulator RecX [Oscillospiraceae bacterium]
MIDEAIRKRAVEILGRRAMSRRELIDKLTQKGEDREAAEEVAHWLVEVGLLNDADYAEMVIRHYAAKGYGQLRIQQELRRRGIDKDLWDVALMEMPEEFDALDHFIQSRLRGEDPDRKEEQRVADALRRRGYNWEEISAGLRRYKDAL